MHKRNVGVTGNALEQLAPQLLLQSKFTAKIVKGDPLGLPVSCVHRS